MVCVVLFFLLPQDSNMPGLYSMECTAVYLLAVQEDEFGERDLVHVCLNCESDAAEF